MAVKQSSKLFIFHTKGLYTVFRDPGAKNNPNSWSLPGTDGDDVASVVEEALAKFGLVTRKSDWEKFASVDNPKNHEINHCWRLNRTVQELAVRPDYIAGVNCFAAAHLWKMRAVADMLISPALASIMDAGANNPEIEAIFGPKPV